jgi:hypothetical protein
VIEGKGTRSMGICSTAVMTGLLSHALKLLSMMKMAALTNPRSICFTYQYNNVNNKERVTYGLVMPSNVTNDKFSTFKIFTVLTMFLKIFKNDML